MNKALLDTDIFSEILKGRDASVAVRAGEYRSSFGRLTISAMTVMEIVKGLHRMGREPAIRSFLDALDAHEVLSFDREVAGLAGRIHADLERAGLSIGWADPIIAATAIRHRSELVTGNTAHFRRIQQLGHPLILNNWRD